MYLLCHHSKDKVRRQRWFLPGVGTDTEGKERLDVA